MEWKTIISQYDINELFEKAYGFHDSCIITANYRTGYKVDSDKTMHFGSESEHELIILFQSQWQPKNIELRFIGVRKTHLTGFQDNYTNELYDAYLKFHSFILPGSKEKLIVRADTDLFSIDNIEDPIQEQSYSYVIANELKWRLSD